MKAGDSRALVLFGFVEPKNIKVEKLRTDKKRVAIGGKVQFEFSVLVRGAADARLRLEYIVYFARAGGAEAKKVFKISERTLPPGPHVIKKNHSFADQSTRKHFPGKHQVAVIVNGVEKARTSITLSR